MGGKNKKAAKQQSRSKWTPDVVTDGGGAHDDHLLSSLSEKLGTMDQVMGELEQDGLDSLLKLPKYRPGMDPNQEDDDDHDAPPPPKTKKAVAVPPAATPKVDKAAREQRDKKRTQERRAGRDSKVQSAAPSSPPAKPEAKKKPQKDKKRAASGETLAAKATEIDALFASLEGKKKSTGADEEGSGGEDEIASVFAQLKELKQAKKTGVAAALPKKKAKRAPAEEDDGFAGRTMTSKRKYTEEGYPIYTEEELRLNSQGGDTPDCPFDCQCCF